MKLLNTKKSPVQFDIKKILNKLKKTGFIETWFGATVKDDVVTVTYLPVQPIRYIKIEIKL